MVLHGKLCGRVGRRRCTNKRLRLAGGVCLLGPFSAVETGLNIGNERYTTALCLSCTTSLYLPCFSFSTYCLYVSVGQPCLATPGGSTTVPRHQDLLARHRPGQTICQRKTAARTDLTGFPKCSRAIDTPGTETVCPAHGDMNSFETVRAQTRLTAGAHSCQEKTLLG